LAPLVPSKASAPARLGLTQEQRLVDSKADGE
jgi:hypothetical protein